MKHFSVLDKKNDSILIEYSCLHITGDDFIHPSLVYGKISSDVVSRWKDFVTLAGHGRNRLILNFLAEGCDPVTAQPIIDVFAEYFDHQHIMAFYNVPVDTNSLPYTAVEWPWYMVRHGNIVSNLYITDDEAATIQLTKKFLCLIRRPSWSRAKFAYAVTNSVDADSLNISFGSLQPSATDLYQPYFNTAQLPLLIDGPTSYTNQHRRFGQDFYSCLFNVVVETSSQTDQYSWRSIFVTEKTFKAFLMRQIPVWFAVPGVVAEVRKMGFDLFDDIIDHSYDSIVNEHQRIVAVSQQLKNLDQTLSLKRCQQLRQRVWQRLNANAELVRKLNNDVDTFQQYYRNSFFEQTTKSNN